jgi:hypothetical protein
MKFFTPELFVQGNSSDDDLVDQVEAAWEEALERYDQHYRTFEAQLPVGMQRFCKEQCLHDADVFAPAVMPGPGNEVVIIAQQVNTLLPETLNTLAILRYTVTQEPTVEIPVVSNVFNDTQPIWLYDEVDVVGPGVFSHEILISNGRVVRVLFRDFRYEIARLVLPERSLYTLLQEAKQPAPPRTAAG